MYDIYILLYINIDNVTTIPLSVCYGALNLLVLADTSNFVPYVRDRAIVGEYEGPENAVPLPLFSLVAWQRNGCTVLGGSSHLVPVWMHLTLGPNSCFYSFRPVIIPVPVFLCPLYCPKFYISSPKRRSQ